MEAAERDALVKLQSDLSWFVEDYRDADSATTWVVDQPDGEATRVTIKPMAPERYLQHTVWDRADRFALVDVPRTFPVEHRPLYDVTQGKMTYDDRDRTIPAIAETLVRLMPATPTKRGWSTVTHTHSRSRPNPVADVWDTE